jgi:Zn-dependent protease with chaperone function
MEETGCATLPYPIIVHISDKKIINAMALPGGHIMVFSGLLKIVTSENEMAFVLAHELGHFNNRDHLRGLGRGIVFAFISTLIGSSDSSIARLAGKTLQVTESGFSREQESAADAFALQTLNCVYGHVGGATNFFNHMPKNLDPGHLGHYFASHPENRKRIQALITLQKEKGYTSGPLTPLKKG